MRIRRRCRQAIPFPHLPAPAKSGGKRGAIDCWLNMQLRYLPCASGGTQALRQNSNIPFPARAIGLLFAVLRVKRSDSVGAAAMNAVLRSQFLICRGIVVIGSRRGSGFDGKAETAWRSLGI